MSWLKNLSLTHFSKPKSDRPIYRWILQHQPHSIMEVGLDDGSRAEKMLQVLSAQLPADAVLKYTGVDPFDSRPPGQPTLLLKSTHQMLSRHGVKARLIPGEPSFALPRYCNSVGGHDLVVISGAASADEMQSVWTVLPRVLNDQSALLWQPQGPNSDFVVYSRDHVVELGEANRSKRAA
ncbi:MAG: hypothetical protein R3C28_24370 [Pirellulaceae bacterium]